MPPENVQAAALAGKRRGQSTEEAAPGAQFSTHPLTRTSRELAITLGHLRPLVESMVTPEWAWRHLAVIRLHLREELAAALEAGL